MKQKMKQVRKPRTKTILMVLVVVAYALSPLVISNNYTVGLLIQVLINGITVMGLNLITGLTGQMNMGTAGIFALGAYTSALLNVRLDINPFLGLIGAVVMGVIIGQLLGYPSLRVKGVYLSLTTIGFSQIVKILLTNLSDLTYGIQGVTGIQKFSLFGFQFRTYHSIFYLYLVLTILLAVLAIRITNSKWGRALKSIRDNPEASEILGIQLSKYKVLAFTLATVYQCIAGCLYAHFMAYIDPSIFTLDFSTNYLIMLMIGGIGSVSGNFLGSFIITMGPEWLRFMGNTYWLVFSVITLLFTIFLPYGLISLFKWTKAKGGKNNEICAAAGEGHKKI